MTRELKFKAKVRKSLEGIYPKELSVTDEVVTDIFEITLKLLRSNTEFMYGFTTYPYDIGNGYIININHDLSDNSVMYGLSSKNGILKVG